MGRFLAGSGTDLVCLGAGILISGVTDPLKEKTAAKWRDFLNAQGFDFSRVSEIDFSGDFPSVFDADGNRFCVDFVNDKRNYAKKKVSLKKELISRALGGGKLGMKVLDLSAGLGIDAVFLAQLGFEVTALERNPLIYLALSEAAKETSLPLKFEFSDARSYLKKNPEEFDVIYFDPMFPEKVKSALPRQEMVFFRRLVGADEDADQVLLMALKTLAKRVVVKRPLKAPVLGAKPLHSLEGKLVRFDIYGVTA